MPVPNANPASAVQGLPALPPLHGQPARGHELTLQFLDGGALVVPCDSYEVDQDRATLICRTGDALEFFPLQHIRRFRAAPRALTQPALN